MAYSLLAGGLKKIQPFLTPILLGVVGVILLIAFIIGFVRGWRKVSWMGTMWATAIGAYVLTEKTLGRKLDNILSIKLAPKMPEPATHLTATVISVVIAVTATLLLFGILNAVFREHYKELHGSGSYVDLDENGISYDEEYEDYDDYDKFRNRNTVIRMNAGTPSVGGRFFGALLCIINTVVVVGVAVCTILMLLGTTSLKTGALSSVYKIKGVSKILSFCYKYLFDFIIVGAFTLISFKGSEIGGAKTLRVILVKIGGFFAVIGAFVVPFTKLAKKGVLLKLLQKCTTASTAMGLTGTFNGIVAKLLTGLLICALVVIALVVLDLLLKGLASLVDEFGFFHGLDTIISTVFYFALAIAVCLVIFGIFALLAKYHIADIGKAFTDKGLAREYLDTARAYLEPLIKKLSTLLKALKK